MISLQSADYQHIVNLFYVIHLQILKGIRAIYCLIGFTPCIVAFFGRAGVRRFFLHNGSLSVFRFF